MRVFFSTIAYRSLLKVNCCLYFTANQKNGEASTIMGDHFLLGKLIIKNKVFVVFILSEKLFTHCYC